MNENDRVLRISIKAIFVSCSILILVFQGNIASIFPAIKYYDEIFAIYVFVVCFFRSKIEIRIVDITIIIAMFAAFVIGCIGNIKSGINATTFLMLSDELGIIKIFFVLFGMRYGMSEKNLKDTVDILAWALQIYVYIAALVYVLALINGWTYFFTRYRFGIPTFGFIHGYAGDSFLSHNLEMAYCVFHMKGKELRYRGFTKFLCLLLILATIKGPALLFLAALALYNYLVQRRKINWRHVLLTIAAGGLVGSWHIKRYLLTAGQARLLLNVTGLKIALQNFPIGLGFATFGSDLSRDYYSPVYASYGLNTIYGLGGLGNYNYIADNYWGMLLGQLGLISTVIFAMVFYRIFRDINQKADVQKKSKYAQLAMFFAFMAGSVGGSYLTSYNGVIGFTIMGIYLNSKWKEIT